MAKYAVPCTIFLVLIHARRCNNCMTEAVDSNTKTDSELLKRVSRMHEVGLSTKDITQQLGIDENTVKKVLQLLGYALAD